jgi:hypothetical protein
MRMVIISEVIIFLAKSCKHICKLIKISVHPIFLSSRIEATRNPLSYIVILEVIFERNLLLLHHTFLKLTNKFIVFVEERVFS